MAESMEYRTIVNLRNYLGIGFKKNMKYLANSFNKDGLIDDKCLEVVVTVVGIPDSDKSDQMVTNVVDSIKLNKENYHVMMKTLAKNSKIYDAIIHKLDQEYEKHGTYCDPL